MQNPLLWLPGLVGFALLAGRSAARLGAAGSRRGQRAGRRAVFTVVMKVGLYGMLTVSLAGGVPPLWWGVMLLALGMITAFIGGLYALMEHNIQRLLAYHTGEYRHYPAGAGRLRHRRGDPQQHADGAGLYRRHVT